MKKFLRSWLLVPGIAALIILSCKKSDKVEEIVTPPDGAGTAIVTGTKSCLATKADFGGGDYSAFEYDTKNRPTKVIEYNSGVKGEYVVLTYNGNDVTWDYYTQNNVKDESYTIKLGSNGYIASASSIDTYTSGGFSYTETYSEAYTYDAEGYRTKLVGTTVTTSNKPGYVTQTTTSTTNYTYSGGNLISSSEVYNGITYAETYEYYTDKLNNLPITSEDDVLSFLMGKKSKNLLKKVSYTSNGTLSSSNSYVYTFNAEGLISKMSETYASTGNTPSTSDTTFEYTCK